MQARNIIIAIAVGVAASIVSLGCYTIIKHPDMQSRQSYNDSEGYTHTAQDRDCMRCHQDYSEYPYGYYYSDYYPDYYWTYPSWGRYYAYPWWWDYYWYKDDNGTVVTGERPDRRRQGITPPYTRGVEPTAPLPPPSFPNSGQIGGSGGGTTTGGSAGSGGGTNTEEKQEEQKPPKRRGGTQKGDD